MKARDLLRCIVAFEVNELTQGVQSTGPLVGIVSILDEVRNSTVYFGKVGGELVGR